jgi:O-antigen/teichoic acid export membrane protein
VSIERQAVAGLKWVGAARLVGQAASWAVTLVVVRILAPSDYGLAALSAVVISVFMTVAELGLGASIVQTPALEPKILSRIAGLGVLLNGGLGLLVVLLAPLAGALFGEVRLASVIRVSALHFGLAAFVTVPQALAQRDMRFRWTASIELAAGLVASLTTLLLAWRGAGVWALVLGSLAGAALRAALFFGGRPVWPRYGLAGLRRHVAFGGAIATGAIAWQVVNQCDVLIAGRFLAVGAVGLYALALHLATLPMQKTIGIVNQVAFPTVARLQGEPARLRQRLLAALRLLGFVSVPVLWGLSAVAPEFVALVLGPRWERAVYPLQVISLIVPARMVSSVISTAITGLGAATLDLRNTAINAGVLPVAFLIGVRWEIEGLATAQAAALGIVLALTLPRNFAVVGVRPADVARALRVPGAAGLAMYAAVLAARALLGGWPDVYRLPALVLAGAVVYLALVSVLEREIWIDLRRLVAAPRG